MNYYNSLTILLMILFFISLFYYIYKNKNTIIGYQTVKEYNAYRNEDYNISTLDKLYKRKSCDDYCSKTTCDEYERKMEYYKNCQDCQKKLLCFNPITNKCEMCISFGINQCSVPPNPINNLCK